MNFPRVSGLRFKLSAALLAALCLAGSASARLGEDLSALKAQYGEPQRPKKDVALWFFEVHDGQVMLTVNFDAEGRSVAEGLKPVQRAVFSRATAEAFINRQLAAFPDSKTRIHVNPGEAYTLAGKRLVCAPGQSVIIDEPNQMLIVWIQTGIPSVLIVRPEMMK